MKYNIDDFINHYKDKLIAKVYAKTFGLNFEMHMQQSPKFKLEVLIWLGAS